MASPRPHPSLASQLMPPVLSAPASKRLAMMDVWLERSASKVERESEELVVREALDVCGCLPGARCSASRKVCKRVKIVRRYMAVISTSSLVGAGMADNGCVGML